MDYSSELTRLYGSGFCEWLIEKGNSKKGSGNAPSKKKTKTHDEEMEEWKRKHFKEMDKELKDDLKKIKKSKGAKETKKTHKRVYKNIKSRKKQDLKMLNETEKLLKKGRLTELQEAKLQTNAMNIRVLFRDILPDEEPLDLQSDIELLKKVINEEEQPYGVGENVREIRERNDEDSEGEGGEYDVVGNGMDDVESQIQKIDVELREYKRRIQSHQLADNERARRVLADKIADLETLKDELKRENGRLKGQYRENRVKNSRLLQARRERYEFLESGEGTRAERMKASREKHRIEEELKENKKEQRFIGAGRNPAMIVRAIMGKNKDAYNISKMKSVSKNAISRAKPQQARSIIRKVIEKRGEPLVEGKYKNPMYGLSYSTLRRRELESYGEKSKRKDKDKQNKRKKKGKILQPEGLGQYTKSQLNKMAKEMGIKSPSKMRRHELIDMMERM